jgi:chromosome segregation ATPase
MVFDLGNLITLGIVILVLIFYRLMDKSNRSLDRARKISERYKEELSIYIEEKGAAIKNYGINLDVEKKSAMELMRRIQTLTREELAEKVNALTEIDDRIRDYDVSLEELVQMTGRVQENLARIREESDFVETIGKRIDESKERIGGVDGEISSLEKKLETIEARFEKENTSALSKAVGSAVSVATSALSDLAADAQTIERKVQEHREVLDKLERDREQRLVRDEERIERRLTEAVDRAGDKADKVEEEVLSKLQYQAEDRLNLIRTNFEEKIRSFQETLKTKITEIQDQLKNGQEEWKSQAANLEAQQKSYTAEWKTQSKEIGASMQRLREDMENASRNTGQELFEASERRIEEYRKVQEERFKQLTDFANDTKGLEGELRGFMQDAVNRINADFDRFGQDMRNKWQKSSGDIDNQMDALRNEIAEVNSDIARVKEKAVENVSKKIKKFEDEFIEDLDKQIASISKNSEDKRKKAEANLADEIKKKFTEVLSHAQKEMDTRILDLETSSENSRKTIEEWHNRYESRMKEADKIVEDIRKRSRDMILENDQRITSARSSLDDIQLGIAAQVKLLEHTDKLKGELDRHVDDMNGHMEKLSEIKNEIARFESQFTQLKRMEEEVNAKMTRFLSEKRRIEGIESDFNRLLQTSKAVEEKLAQVSSSDDILQNMQVQIRQMEDAIKDAEEKAQRIERKSNAFQETTNGIDRNFKALQEGEATVKRLQNTIAGAKSDMEAIRNSVDALSTKNEKARDAAEKLSTLDESVVWLEKKIAEMNVARESLARLATEMQSLDKDAQNQLRLTRTLLDREAVKTTSRAGKADDGAPPTRDRENIIRLKRQGWTVDEIARTLKTSKGEVELILELGAKDL